MFGDHVPDGPARPCVRLQSATKKRGLWECRVFELNVNIYKGARPRIAEATALMRNRNKKTKKQICASPASEPAMPLKPKMAARTARINKVIARLNM